MRGEGVRVLVVGAGIAGLAATRALRAWGAAVDVVERAAGPEVDGFGIYLPGNATRALDRLGLGPPVAARAVGIRRQRFSDHRGRPLCDVDVTRLWDGVGPCLALHRADLREVLLDGVAGIRWGTSVRSIAPYPDEIRVSLTDGIREGYDLVVGADGVRSAVRRLVFDIGGPRPVGQYARRFLAKWPDAAPVWSVMLARGATFLSIPIGGGLAYCYCDTGLDRRDAPLRDVLRGFAEPVPTLLAAIEGAPHGAMIEEVALPSWSHDTVVLVGDAAHATSPNMAEGAAMALEDAIVLAGSLADASTIRDALAAYERRRRPRTGWVAAQTHRRDRMRGLAPPLRNLVLRRYGTRIFQANYRPLLEPP
jgi:2-polyprenyl-6-methoxyphenol hydroxylase-like FAD-dependent oxidoreductase